MDCTGKMKKAAIALTVMMALLVKPAASVKAATCDEGTSLPPFLGVETVPPNVMLMVDNSGSMYDLNYIENIGYCFDDSYNNSSTYAGYFLKIRELIENVTVWYAYSGNISSSSGNMEYVRIPDANANDSSWDEMNTACNAATGTKYRAADPTGNEFLCVSIDETDPDPTKHIPTFFAATGKFLNWITTSKMDVQKLVLTGGKWDNHPINGTPQLIPESRGCLDRRSIKEVTVNGGAAKLSFAVRNDDDDMDGDGSINNTVIDLHAASTGGFNNTACQEVLTALQSPTGVGGVKTPLKECLGGFEEKKTPEGDMISAFNLSIQDCWYMSKFGVDEWRKVFNSAAIRNQCDTLYEGNGFYSGRYPWEMPTDVTGLVCRGNYDKDAVIDYNFVGRCYVPSGYPPAGAFNEEEAQGFQLAEMPQDFGAGPGAGILPDWGETLADGSLKQEGVVGTPFKGVAANLNDEKESTISREPLIATQPAPLTDERNTLAEAIKEFIKSGGRNEQARQKVLNAFYKLFVAEASAAAGVVEETQATCTGFTNVTSGASGGTSYYSDINGETCTFLAEGNTYTHGFYEVFVISPCEGAPGNRNTATEFTVNHANGTTTFIQNQKDNCDVWIKIPGPEENETFEFLKNTGSVEVTSTSNTKKSYADAVQFAIYKEIPPPPPPPTSGFHPYVLEITPLSVSPTDDTTISFRVIFSEGVVNFNGADDVVTEVTGIPGTLAYTGVTITDIGPLGDQNRIFQVDLTGISGAGDITLAVNSWVRDWSEKSLAGSFNEENYFLISPPYPDHVRFGDYIVEVGPTGTEVVETNLSVGYSTLVQNRSNLIDYPADTNCCSGDPLTDYCCNPADWPFTFASQYTHYLSPAGWSDSGTGVDWLVGDAITFSIVPGSDTRGLLGNTVVSFSVKSAPVTRLEPIPETCTGDYPTGPAWWCDSCIEEAIIDFCGFLSTPEVIDPTDQSSIASSGDYWNVPALLWDAAINGQLDDKIGSMAAKVKINFTPKGIIHKYADDIRFGVMGFHPYGEKSECGDYGLFTDCAYDGAKVAVPVDQGSGHTAAVTAAINAYDGNTWTPLAESMYTAIGYYTQKGGMRLDSGDYEVNADTSANATWDPVNGVAIPAGGIVNVDGVNYVTPGGGIPSPDATNPMDDSDISDWEIASDPIIAYCQRNFVLAITEGSSTADLNPTVETFALANTDADVDAISGGCDALKGSSYFDDIVHYGWNGTNIYEYEPFAKDKNNIEAHIVDTRGSKTGTGECNPFTLLQNAAENTNRVDKNGDGIAESTETALYSAARPEELWRTLDLVLRNIITQTSSGSAASVISASRSGEGALYQALFWPATLSDLPSPNPPFVDWLGEVHAFFVDSSGNLREDSDNDGLMSDTDEIVVLYWDEAAEITQACNGVVANGACTGTTKSLSAVNYLWSTTDWLSNPVMDSNIEYNRGIDAATGEYIFDPISPKRYIFTWNDLDNDGTVDGSEVLQFQKYFDAASPLDPPFPAVTALNRAPLNIDFGVHPDGEDVNGDNTLNGACEDIDRDGILDAGEDTNGNNILDLGEDSDCDGTLDNWAGVTNNIIDWVRGKDIYGYRKRDLLYDIDKNPLNGKEQITWRLGDVVHSTPLSVASPAENYHQLYRDFSYAQFLVQYQNRRHVVYFGANDGMLHAVNGGFFKRYDDPSNPSERISRFCRTKDCVVDPLTGVEQNTASAPVLGAELWAYVPYNIIPQLSCLTDVNYDHKYFVDLRPRIFDVQIFNNDADHPNGWGTILVGGMRFGGSKVQPGGHDEDGNPRFDFNGDLIPDYNDNREFTSAYFILDITNPEKPPTLLGEFTRTIEDVDLDGTVEDFDGDGIKDESPHVELGYTTNISTMVPMRINEDVNGNGIFDSTGVGDGEDLNCNGTFDVLSKWYLIIGSGPTEIDGTSSQFGNISVVPLDRFVDDGSGSDPVLDMRIPAPDPSSTDNFRSFELPDDKSFTADIITVDMETNKNYMADVVYFGSNSGDWATGWDGKLQRLVVRKWQECNGSIVQVESEPKEWSNLYEPNTTPFMPLIDVEQPITTSPTVATDGRDFWVYFGTGRFFDIDDKYNQFSNATQTFYGIREPVSNVLDDLFYRGVQPLSLSGNPVCQLSWAQALNDRLGLPTGGLRADGITPLTGRGGLGILGVTDITILSSQYIDQPGTLGCEADPSQVDPLYCLPASLKVKLDQSGNPLIDPISGDNYTGSYQDLIEYLTGDYYNCNGTELGLDGWYRNFQDPRERNLGQASLLGGLLSFTTYQPFAADLCRSEGLGFLYGLYYQTGTPWFEDVFGLVDSDVDPRQENPLRLELGKGLSTTPNIHVGEEEGGKAFVQTSVGKIKEIPQPKLPSKHVKSGRIKWRDVE